MKLVGSSFAIAMLLTAAGPALAQKTVDGVFVPKGNTLAEVKQQQAANQEQAKAARAQLDQNAANKAAHDQAQAAHDQAVQAYQAQLAQQQQQQADTEQAHAAAVEKWKADVAACAAGDASRCAGN